MKRMVTLFIVGFVSSFSLFASEETDAIKNTVTSAYVEGIHIEGNLDKIRAGFHPDFTMTIFGEDGLRKVSIADWMKNIEKANAKKTGDEPKPNVEHTFEVVDYSGNAAIARVELHRDGKHVFTDYLSLYKGKDGWKIVAKIFYRHK
ncbi:MAG: nuclear transport factor 2 family protein [Calditrichia bacterium]